MQRDLETAGNRPRNGLNSKLRNQIEDIPPTPMMGAVLQTNISAACWAEDHYFEGSLMPMIDGVILQDRTNGCSWLHEGKVLVSRKQLHS